MNAQAGTKASERKDKKGFQKRFVKITGPEFIQLIHGFQKLSSKERKQFQEEKANISEFIRLGLGNYPEDFNLDSISTDFREYRKFLKRLEDEIELAEIYLSKHKEIPEKIRELLLLFYHIGSPELLDMLASD